MTAPSPWRTRTAPIGVEVGLKSLVAAAILAAALIGNHGSLSPVAGVLVLAGLGLDVRHPFTSANLVLAYSVVVFGYGSTLFSVNPAQTQEDLLLIVASFLLGRLALAIIRKGPSKRVGMARVYGQLGEADERRILSIVVRLTMAAAAVNVVQIAAVGPTTFFSGQALAQGVTAYGATGATSPFEYIGTFLNQLILAATLVYSAVALAKDKRVAYKWVAGPLVLLPVITLQRGQAFMGGLALLGVYAMDRRLHPRARTRTSLAVQAIVVIAVVVVAAVLVGRARQDALSAGSQAGATGLSKLYEEELTPVHAFSEIEEYLPILGEQKGRTIVLPALERYVPRSVYAAKADNSNTYYMKTLHPSSYSAGLTLPTTVFGDGLLNFGVPGVGVISFLLGVVTFGCDRSYIEGRREGCVVYLLAFGNAYFLLRDCLANTLPQIVLMVVVGFWLLRRTGSRSAATRDEWSDGGQRTAQEPVRS